MTRHFPPPRRGSTTPATVLIEAARCWRMARDKGELVQPSLTRLMAEHDAVMLVPVLESLIRLYETALGRPVQVGEFMTFSEDELLLLSLVEGERLSTGLGCTHAAAHILNCALCTTRLMLAQTLGYMELALQ